ncbi:MAG: sigma-70 domain-containing protein [Eubacteriales bacterium]|nr:sigma-70 domain-containing protein [Eubacteriales bacterium]
MHDDIYQMYLEEIEAIQACTPEEEAELLARISLGDEEARKRLLEGSLSYIAELSKGYAGQGVPMGDLIQEANMALILALGEYGSQNKAFRDLVKEQVEEALTAAVAEQKQENDIEEEMVARVNVLKDISAKMAEDLGREATVEELAETMKMTVDEIKDIMKLTLDAMSVSPDAEE